LFTNKKVIDADVDLPKFKIRRDFGQLQTLTANISGADRHTENRYSKIDRLASLPRWTQKFGELWSTNKQVAGADVDTR